MMTSSDLRLIARNSLSGNWGSAVLVTLVAMLLGAEGGSGSVNFDSSDVELFRDLYRDPVIASAITTVLIVIGIYGLVSFIIGGAVQQGLALYNTRLIHRVQVAPFRSLFERFDNFGKALGLRVVSGIFIFLWTLLLIVPGIMASYSYAMAPYLMAHYPEMGITDAIKESKRIMYGHRFDLFVLHLSFIGWSLLAVLTLGVGLLWLNPYIYAAEAAFYLDLMNQLPAWYRPQGQPGPA